MAFDLQNFAPVGNSSKRFTAVGSPGAPSFHSYATNDTQADVNTSGYFDSISGLLSVYDTIRAVVDVDGTPAVIDFIVLSNSGGVVDVSDGVAIALTDTD